MAAESNRGKSASRPLRMLALMMRGETLDANSAAKRFGVKRAMARRDLLELVKHVPGVAQNQRAKPHTFSFQSEARIPADAAAMKARSKLHDVIAASLGASFSSVFRGTRYQTDLEKLRRDLVSRLARRRNDFEHANRKFFALAGREEVLEDKSELLDDVVQAVLAQQTIEIHYQNFGGTEKQLRVDPYSLVVYDSHLYVVGVDVTGDPPKPAHPYRFARIRKLHLTKHLFAYPSPSEYDPSVIFRDSIGVWLSDPPPCTVRVKLTAYWAVYAQHHRWHQSQRLTKHKDGAVELTLQVRPCLELEQWILRFGENAEVLEPTFLREKIATRLDDAVKLYPRARRRSRRK